MMKKALIVIDYIYDFVAADGRLTCGEPGGALEKKIARHIREFSAAGDYIVNAADYHTEGDIYSPEAALFPPHCLAGDKGRELYGEAFDAYGEVPEEQKVTLDKTRYSAFAGTRLDILLRERRIGEVYLCGVCTDICVLHTAVDAYNLGYKLAVYGDAVAGFDTDAGAFALRHIGNVLGGKIV
jgi:nicotinamidase-related amidase